MKILVYIKQVPDTDEVKVDPVTGNLKREGVDSKMNPPDKHAIEAAIQLKEQYAEVYMLLRWASAADDILKEALAMGCDESYLLTDRKLGGADTLATAIPLQGRRKIGDYDLLLCGKHAVDENRTDRTNYSRIPGHSSSDTCKQNRNQRQRYCM